jgi:HK97 family phage portal protein
VWPFPRRAEQRASLENPRVSLSDAKAWAEFFNSWNSSAGITVNVDVALGVPAIWCAVNFLAGTIGALPLHLFKKSADGRERVETGMLAGILGGTVNDDLLTSFKWRKRTMLSALLTGAGRTYVEKDTAGRPVNLWPLETGKTEVERKGGRTLYHYRDGDRVVTYEAHEVIDIPFMLALDGVGAVDPVHKLRDTIGLAVALEQYASRFFQNGGVPPLVMSGPPASPAAITRGTKEVDEAVRGANREQRNILYMPLGHDLKAVGFNPEQGQLVEAKRFVIEQIARMFGLPPVFLQDLTRGTYSNTEQQDLHFVKHTLTQWLELWEQELNAKLFGPRNFSRFVEFNADGILRGDFKTRMDGYATAIQNAIRTPDEVRSLENLPTQGGEAAKLHIQGATVPLGEQGKAAAKPADQAGAPKSPPPAANPLEGSDDA